MIFKNNKVIDAVHNIDNIASFLPLQINKFQFFTLSYYLRVPWYRAYRKTQQTSSHPEQLDGNLMSTQFECTGGCKLTTDSTKPAVPPVILKI